MKNSNQMKTVARQLVGEDPSHWAFISEWHVQEQSNDRMPASGAAAHNSPTASVRRSLARQTHQLEYKRWSKQRHD